MKKQLRGLCSNRHSSEIRQRILDAFVSLLVTCAVAVTPAKATSPFEDGRADRRGWETWFNGLTGDFREGAEFWAAHRSDPQPPSCSDANSCLGVLQRMQERQGAAGSDRPAPQVRTGL